MDSVPPPPQVASVPPGPPVPGSQVPASGPRRPWYLVGALLFAWIFGAAAFIDGCNNAMLLHQGHIDLADKFTGAASDTLRAAEIAATEQYFDVWFAAHNRLFPLNVAGFLLGAALVWAAARAMAGRSSARSPVMQIALAQAVLAIVTFVLTPDVRAAQIALALSQVRDSGGDADAVAWVTRNYPRIARFAMVGFLAARTFFAMAIVVCLTRAKARAFFEATDKRASER
ncbi:MAG: hypothetical protein ABI461_20600 [Polyangiaceae bacterium]